MLFAACSGGCSRSVQVYVRNGFPFPIFVHERTVWRNMSWTKDRGKIAPQDVSLAAEISRGETMHLQVLNSKGQVLCQVTVSAATVQQAYQEDTEIVAEMGPKKSTILLLKSPLANPANTWRTFGIVTAVLIASLFAVRFWQKRM